MLFVLNGVFKENEITVDVVQINPNDYDLDKNCIWFDVGVSVGEAEQQKTITVYLLDLISRLISFMKNLYSAFAMIHIKGLS